MLNWLILYNLPMSYCLYFYNHNRVVVAGLEGVTAKGLGKFHIRAWVLGFFLCVAILADGLENPLGAGYVAWWKAYTCEHSALLWLVVVVPMTLALWGLKVITFLVSKGPGIYLDPKNPLPNLCKINMRTPFFWNTVLWAWLLGSPWLPFEACFLRIFLLRQMPRVVLGTL